MAEPLAQVEVAVGSQSRDPAYARRRRLQVLGERHGVDRDANVGQQIARVLAQARLPPSGEHPTVLPAEVGLERWLDARPQLVISEQRGREIPHRVVRRGECGAAA